ncbi:unnamed protein product [Closterium sp. Yama58-4]|nr:unnamed protein product [Closterium sp. Yama58-4]
MRRIVVAVDGSDGSDMAVHYALQRIADPLTDHLFLLHVKTPRHLPSDSLPASSPTCLPSSPRASSFARRGNVKDHTATAAAVTQPTNGRYSRKRQHDFQPVSAWPSAFSGPSESYHAARSSSASFGASTDRAAALLASCFLDPAAAAAPGAPVALTPWQMSRAPIGRLSESGAGAGIGGGTGAEPLRHVRRRSVDGLRLSGSSASAAPESAEMRKAAVAAALMLESAFESSGGAAAAARLDGATVAGTGDQKAKAASAALWSRMEGGSEGSGSVDNRHGVSLPAVHCFPGGFGAVKSGEKRAVAANAGTGSDDWASRFRGADAYGAAGGAWCGGSGGSVRAHGRRLGRPMRQQQQQHMDVKVARWLERFAREAEQMGVACDTAVVEAMDPCAAVLCRVHAVHAHLLILSGHLADSAGGAAAFASEPHTSPAPPVAAAAAARGGLGGVGVRGNGGVESGCPVLVVRPGGRGRIRDHRSSLMEF